MSNQIQFIFGRIQELSSNIFVTESYSTLHHAPSKRDSLLLQYRKLEIHQNYW